MSASPKYNSPVAQLGLREDEMARRRLQQKGHLHQDGNWWRLRFREYDAAGNAKRRSVIIGLAAGPERLTKRQAASLAWELYLSKVDAHARVPGSIITIRQFATQHFQRDVVDTRKHAGQQHYKYTLSKILPALGDLRLRDLKLEHVQGLLRTLLANGLSVQTAVHVRNSIHAILEHAKRLGSYAGDNLASLVRLPELVAKRPHALTFEDGSQHVLPRMPMPVRIMVLLQMATSPNVAELCGLRWRRLNLGEEFAVVDDEALPPRSMAIRENYYRNRPGTVKTKRRNRVLPLPAAAVEMLRTWKRETKFASPDDYVFACSTGRPIDAHNTNSRLFKQVAAEIEKATGRRLKLTWHVFRHSCATFAEQVGMARSDRISMMGHGSGRMTDHYTHEDVERRRQSVEEIAVRLMHFGPSLGPGGSVVQ